jgi:alkylmercury lyase
MTSESLADQLEKTLWNHRQPLYRALLRVLATGRPASADGLAEALGISGEEVRSSLKTFQDIQYDATGNVVAAGLSLVPTPHRLWLDHQALFAWCALDTLMYPVLLHQTAQVESPCPVTGTIIRLTVTPTQIVDLDPPSAVVSIVVPTCSTESCSTRGEFCNLVHFFSSAEAAGSWKVSQPQGYLVSVAEAYQLGRALVSRYDNRI